jgi:hypothetical protein
MFLIPWWLSNILLLTTCVLSAIQHVLLRRPNPVTNLQFFMMGFTLLMILIIAWNRTRNPWLSLAAFLIAVGCLGLMIRQQRMMPPTKSFE